jgi:hypothetical protein
MGFYSTLQRSDTVKTLLSIEEFMNKWNQAIEAIKGTAEEGYLDFYIWKMDSDKDGFRFFSIDMDDRYAKHYADSELAEFISGVIAPGASCILEFTGEDGGQWGYYVQPETVKDIEYVRMVDGKPIKGGEGNEGLLHAE